MSSIFSPEFNSGESNNSEDAVNSGRKSRILTVLLGMAIVLAAGEGFYCRSLTTRIQGLQTVMQTQLSSQNKSIQRLHDQLGTHEVSFTDIQGDLNTTRSALSNTQGQVLKEHRATDELVKQQKAAAEQVNGQLTQLQADQETSTAVIGSLSSDVRATKVDLASARTTCSERLATSACRAV